MTYEKKRKIPTLPIWPPMLVSVHSINTNIIINIESFEKKFCKQNNTAGNWETMVTVPK